jgi:hypothetical protein
MNAKHTLSQQCLSEPSLQSQNQGERSAGFIVVSRGRHPIETLLPLTCPKMEMLIMMDAPPTCIILFASAFQEIQGPNQ